MEQMSRRRMIHLLGLTGAGFATNLQTNIFMQSDKKMITRPIPSTGEMLPVIGLGTWQQFDVGSSEAERRDLKEVLRALHQSGGSMIDSSPMYGRAEEVVGQLTTEINLANDFFYATKVWTNGEQNGIQQMEDSIKKMKRKKLDLMQIHNLVDWRTHLKTMRNWKEKGRIKYIGITHYTRTSHAQLEQILKSDDIDFLQVNYSIKERNAEKSLLNTCIDRKVAVIVNQPFESGSLFNAVKGKELPEWVKEYDIKSWGQFFLKYIISHPAINCVIPGTSNPKHMLDNVAAGMGRMPDDNTRQKMIAVVNSL